MKNRHGLGVLEREVDSVEDYSMNFPASWEKEVQCQKSESKSMFCHEKKRSKILHN